MSFIGTFANNIFLPYRLFGYPLISPISKKKNENGQFSMFTFDYMNYMNTVEVQKMNNLELNQTFL